jgi:hypothetical protein
VRVSVASGIREVLKLAEHPVCVLADQLHHPTVREEHGGSVLLPPLSKPEHFILVTIRRLRRVKPPRTVLLTRTRVMGIVLVSRLSLFSHLNVLTYSLSRTS